VSLVIKTCISCRDYTLALTELYDKVVKKFSHVYVSLLIYRVASGGRQTGLARSGIRAAPPGQEVPIAVVFANPIIRSVRDIDVALSIHRYSCCRVYSRKFTITTSIPFCQELTVAVELLDAIAFTISDIDIPLCVNSDSSESHKLAILIAATSPLH
jgi:hypothetical protein